LRGETNSSPILHATHASAITFVQRNTLLTASGELDLTPVPLPGSAVLLLSALAMLGGGATVRARVPTLLRGRMVALA
jgi:hypothetical protein